MPAQRKRPDVLTEAEGQALAAVANPRYPTGLRDRALIRLMLNTGLRTSECLTVKVSDIDWVTGQLRVAGRGKRGRTLWVDEDVLSLLRKWLERRPVEHAFLFTTLDGKPVQDRALRAMIKRRARKAGITKDVHPHTLRHSFAMEMYRRTRNLERVQQLLGHAELSTTMIYEDLVDDDVQEAMKYLSLV